MEDSEPHPSRNFTSSNNLGLESSNSFVASHRKDGDRSTSQINKSVKCHECEGFRRYQAKCATYLKRKKNGLAITLFDEETSSDSDCEDFGRALIDCKIEEKIEVTDGKLFPISEEDGYKLDTEISSIPTDRIYPLISKNYYFSGKKNQ